MSFRKLVWMLLAVSLLSVTAKADTIDTVYFNGGYAFANNGVGIPPYQGTLNGQSAEFYCVDFSHEITGNTSWQATVTNLGASSYSATRLGSSTIYYEIAWLLDQSLATTNQTTQAELQWAVWSFSGGWNPYGTNSTLVAEALSAVQNGFTDNSWEILTPVGKYGQEFFVRTPEPSTLGLLIMGLIALAGFVRIAQPEPQS
jgi:hypothetical protein